MRNKSTPTIHEGLAAIDQRVVKARQVAREAELDYRRGQEAIARADQVHLDQQAAKVAGQPSDPAEAAKALERAKSEAPQMRDLEIARRAVELAERERTAFLAEHEDEFERYFAEQYAEAARKVQESESAIAQAYALWQEASGRHQKFRQAIGRSTHDVPQTPQRLRDTHKAIGRARELRAA